jgi:DNA-binding XRE family transcriptional regulator
MSRKIDLTIKKVDKYNFLNYYPIIMKVDGSKIKLIRESRQMTQGDLAAGAGVSRQAVISWEKGGVGSFRILNKIADLLKVNPEILLDKD